MRGIAIHSSTKTNQLQLNIPDELKGMEFQIIILPANQTTTEIEFFTEAELSQLPAFQPRTGLEKNEDVDKPKSQFGSGKGMVKMHADFDKLLEDFKDYM